MKIDADLLTARLERLKHEQEQAAKHCEDPAEVWGYVAGLEKAIELVDGMPRIKKGVWLEDDYGYCSCSICRFEIDSPEFTTSYCPGCGAEMENQGDELECLT